MQIISLCLLIGLLGCVFAKPFIVQIPINCVVDPSGNSVAKCQPDLQSLVNQLDQVNPRRRQYKAFPSIFGKILTFGLGNLLTDITDNLLKLGNGIQDMIHKGKGQKKQQQQQQQEQQEQQQEY